jgi:hypothetical protein
MLMHIPKVGMLLGAKSMIVQVGVVVATGLGLAVITAGVVPMEQFTCEPLLTMKGISINLPRPNSMVRLQHACWHGNKQR